MYVYSTTVAIVCNDYIFNGLITVMSSIAYDMGSISADVFLLVQVKIRTLTPFMCYVMLSTRDEHWSEFFSLFPLGFQCHIIFQISMKMLSLFHPSEHTKISNLNSIINQPLFPLRCRLWQNLVKRNSPNSLLCKKNLIIILPPWHLCLGQNHPCTITNCAHLVLNKK